MVWGPSWSLDFIGRSQFVFTIGCEASWGGVTRPSQAGALYLGAK